MERVLIVLAIGASLAHGGCGKASSEHWADAAATGGSLGGSAGAAVGGAGGIAPGRGGAAGVVNPGSGGIIGTGGATSTGILGTGGSTDVCAGKLEPYPGFCRPLCQGGSCFCYCEGGIGGAPLTGGVGAGGLASGGAGGKGGGGAGAGGANGFDAATGDAVAVLDVFSAIDGPTACSQLTAQTACEARSDCYAVFVDPSTCGCAAAGCCARFDHCAAGTPSCNGSVSCTTATPHCEGPYVVSYASGCYQGCVRQSACGQYETSCPQAPPAEGATCRGNGATCVYQNCAGAGRTEATCSADGTWKLTTMSCDAFKCVGAGTTSTTLICEAGEVCVLTTGGGGAYSVTPACIPNKCSPAALSLSCMGLDGNCYVDSDNAISCRQPSSCGSGQGGCQ